MTRRDSSGYSHRHDVVMDEKKRIGWSEMRPENRPPFYRIVADGGHRWLNARSSQNGFEVAATDVSVERYMRYKYSNKNGKQRIQFSTLDFTGILTVTRPDDFINMLFSGIGKSRAFGCGLMLVRRSSLR